MASTGSEVQTPKKEGRVEDMASKEAAAKFNSAAAFVESGVQEVYEDACSICLETFTEEEPLTLTTCNHDYHLQCILEWAQRRQECPMCWQPLSLKDPESQELLAACSQEQAFHASSVYTPPFMRSPFEEFEFQHRQYSSSYPEEADLERRIMQHLAAAAAGMSRARLVSSSRSPARHGQNLGGQQTTLIPADRSLPSPRITNTAIQTGTLVVGSDSRISSPDSGSRGSTTSSLSSMLRPSASVPVETSDVGGSGQQGVQGEAILHAVSSPPMLGGLSRTGSQTMAIGQSGPLFGLARTSSAGSGFQSVKAEAGGSGSSSQNRSPTLDSRESSSTQRSGENSQSGMGSGELSSLGDVFKTRWAAASSRYRETLTKGTRSFRDRLRLRGGSVADISAKAREVGAGVVRAFERMSDPGPSTSDSDCRSHTENQADVVPTTGGTSTSASASPDRTETSICSSGSPSPEHAVFQIGRQSGQEQSSGGVSAPLSSEGCSRRQIAPPSESVERGVQAGSVSASGRFTSEEQNDKEEVLFKTGSDANSVTEPHQTSALTA